MEFGKKVHRTAKDSCKNIRQALADVYKNTGAKLVLNFGTAFAPVIENFGDLMEELNANEYCDQECAVKCWEPEEFFDGNMFGFDSYCLKQECGCTFRFAEIENE